jgi:hypothetical protein
LKHKQNDKERHSTPSLRHRSLSLERRLAPLVASACGAKIAAFEKETSDAEILSAPAWTPLSCQHHPELFPQFVAPGLSRRCVSALCKGELIMFLAILGVTLRGLLFTITGSCFVAEFSGYWLHRMLHSDRFPALSRPFNCSGYRIAQLRYHLNRDLQEDSSGFPSSFRAWDVPPRQISSLSPQAAGFTAQPGREDLAQFLRLGNLADKLGS